MEQNLTPASVVALFDTTKEQRQTFVTMLIESIGNGEVDALKIHTQVKAMEDLITQLKEEPQYRESVLTAAQQYGKRFQFGQAEIAVQEVGTKYDYSVCQDPEYDRLKVEADAAAAALKDRAKFLQTVPTSGLDVLDQNTGELSKIFPPAKSSTTSVVVKLK